jgi:quinol monooxygenase YgiN
MTCKVVLEIKAKPDHVDDLLRLLNEQLPATRAHEGCIEVNGYQDQDDPTTILAIHEWESREHYEKYFAWRVEQGDIEAVRPMVAQPLSKRFFDKKA